MRLFDHVRNPGSVHGVAELRTRLLRQFLVVTTVLYGVGVIATVLPHGSRVTADIAGGIVAVCLGIAGLVTLWLRPRTTAGQHVALGAAMLATPAVMAFHVLTAALFPCLIAAMFLAMYIRAFHRSRDAHIAIGVLITLVLLATLRSSAPVYPITYLIFAVAIFAAAETFGSVTKALIAASCTDPLTGVLNRAGWEIATTEAVTGPSGRRVDPSKLPVTVVIVDVDNFKAVNDTQGHRAGDELLANLAATWTRAAPEGTVVARIGGDEFAALLSGHPEEIVDDFVSTTVEYLPYTSIGVAASRDADEPISDLLARADAELYQAKRGRTGRL